VALRLAGAWADAGHDVRLLMGRNEGPERSIAPHNVVYDFAPPHPLARPFETLWMVRQLIAAVRRHRPDVLFCAGNTYTIVAAFVRLFLRTECPPIVCKLSNSLDRRDLPLPVRLGYRIWLRQHPFFIEHFIGLSEPMRREIEKLLGVSSERVSTIPNPVLTDADLNELSGPQMTGGGEGRRFVAVGRLTRQKNYRLLLHAFARIARANDRLLIAGDGPERKRLGRIARKLGINALVHLPGHESSVASLLKTADVFVTSSNYEGMPGAVVEALAAGMPIVATRSSRCLSYLLRYGKFGQLVQIRDVEGLAQALGNAPTRHTLPTYTMRSVAGLYTIERSADLYLNVLMAAAFAQTRSTAWTESESLAEAA
jgi:glycosyltransferase involved in cell wall biosynthesis